MAAVIRPLLPRDVVAPLLPSLPAAAMASEPAPAVLPLLSPILRQRVRFLSASSSEPWIRLLSYDASKAARLVDVARSARFEPHPVSGEIEIDWDSAAAGGGVAVRYCRLDVETLQALVLLADLDLVFCLVYCDGDAEGGGSGWRVGEVNVPDQPDAFARFGGYASVAEAEEAFQAGRATVARKAAAAPAVTLEQPDDDDDDDYWARYDATPARTPAVKRSPAPALSSAYSSLLPQTSEASRQAEAEAEDDYFAQYDSVQPAMDSHDPDEAAAAAATGVVGVAATETRTESAGATAPALTRIELSTASTGPSPTGLVHPRPSSLSVSSDSSSGGSTALVAKLEQTASRREENEFGIRQHVSRSIKSLYQLAQSAGIDRKEFGQLVRTELDMLAMLEEA